eukprot:1339835-Pleurochrysis_carterae.AAC.1
MTSKLRRDYPVRTINYVHCTSWQVLAGQRLYAAARSLNSKPPHSSRTAARQGRASARAQPCRRISLPR